MILTRRRYSKCGLALASALIAVAPCAGQPADRSPSDLVKSLTHPGSPEQFLFSCGVTDEDREDDETARLLTEFGPSAVPALERALDSIAQQGRRSEYYRNAWRLAIAYARIEGPMALPRLERLANDPNLDYFESAVDSAIAVSRGLTSYVSFRPWRSPPPVSQAYCGRMEPRDSLDRLLLSWGTGARQSLEAGLGAQAKASLNALMRGRTWTDLRADLWHGGSLGAGMGYLFDYPKSEPLPSMTVGGTATTSDADAQYVQTKFQDSAGRACGTYPVRFVLARGKYAVDNSDLQGLLFLVASCAIATKAAP